MTYHQSWSIRGGLSFGDVSILSRNPKLDVVIVFVTCWKRTSVLLVERLERIEYWGITKQK